MIRTLSERTMHELQELLRWWRHQPRQRLNELAGDMPVGPYYTRMFRTQGDDPDDLADASYPTQVDGAGVKLPGVFLIVNTTTLEYEAIPGSHEIYSIGGWIPRLMDLRVSFRGGVWVPDYVPLVPCRLDAGVTAPNTVTVEIRESGTMDTQTFTAHLDWMAGAMTASTDDEAMAWLNERTQQWEIINLEC